MTGSDYYEDILQAIDESEVDNMISQLRDVARFHNITPYQMLIHLIKHKEHIAQSENFEDMYYDKFN